ncbi:MAG: hypothetical protein ABI389_09650 [Rhodanobacter sp.]
MSHGLYEQMLALVMFHAANVDNFVIELATMESFGRKNRRVKDLAIDAIEVLESRSDDVRVRKYVTSLAYGGIVGRDKRVTDALVLQVVWKSAVFTVPQIVEHPYMMNKPEDFVGVCDEMRRRAKTDDSISRTEIHPPVGSHMLKEQLRTINLRQVDKLNLMPFRFKH